MKTLNNKLVYSFLFVTIFSILQPVLLFSQNSTKSRIVDPVKQWHRIEGAIAATRYPFLGATEKEWPSDYRTVVNGFQENFGLNGPEGMGFIYPGIVIFDGRGNIKEIVLGAKTKNGWLVFGGIIYVLFALVVIHAPILAGGTLVRFIGIFVAVGGVALTIFSLKLRSAQKKLNGLDEEVVV